jgi:FMN reductase (NADPH)
MSKKFNETYLSKFQARYGREIPDNHYPSNQFIENILSRKTIRRFQDKEIDPKLIEKLIAVAQSAPTSSMLQPWSVISLSKEKRKILLKEEHAHWLGIAKRVETQARPPTDPTNARSLMECSYYLIWLADWSILRYIFTDNSLDTVYPDLAAQRIRAEEASYEMHYELRSIIDTTIAAQTFCLAAESLGLGVQYMGSIRNMDLKEDLNLPDHVMPLFGMCIGYPLNEDLNIHGGMKVNQYQNKQTFIKPRLPQQLIFHEDEHKGVNVKKLHEYNTLMRSFYEYYNLGRDWFYRTIDRTFPLSLSSSFKDLAKKYGFIFK